MDTNFKIVSYPEKKKKKRKSGARKTLSFAVGNITSFLETKHSLALAELHSGKKNQETSQVQKARTNKNPIALNTLELTNVLPYSNHI